MWLSFLKNVYESFVIAKFLVKRQGPFIVYVNEQSDCWLLAQKRVWGADDTNHMEARGIKDHYQQMQLAGQQLFRLSNPRTFQYCSYIQLPFQFAN